MGTIERTRPATPRSVTVGLAFVLAMAMVAVVAPTPALAVGPAVTVVDDDGVDVADCGFGQGVSTHDTIQGGVDTVGDGGTVYVCPGTYTEQVVISAKSVTLQGAGDTTIVRPAAAAALVASYTYPAGTFWPGTVMGAIVLVQNSNDVTIRDLKVDGVNVTSVPVGASRLAGILYGEASGIIDNATVTTIKTTAPSAYYHRSYGIDLSAAGASRGVEVKNSHITDWSRNGIQAQGASLSADIHDNTLVGPGSASLSQAEAVPNGILFIHGVDGNATDNIIHALHTNATPSRSAGILFYDALTPGIIAEGNEIYDVDDGVDVAHNANDVIVRQNNLHDNLETGVHLEDGATNNVITNNTIANNAMVGIRFAGPTDPGGPALADDPPGVGNVAHRNSITGNGTGVANYDAALQTFDATCNWWGDAGGPGVGAGDTVSTGVTFDPWFLTDDVSGACESVPLVANTYTPPADMPGMGDSTISLRSPNGGTVTIVGNPVGADPSGWVLFGQEYTIEYTGPAASVDNPLVIVFVIDSSIAGTTLAGVNVFHDDNAVPACTGAPSAIPDPCVSSRVLTGGGDFQITVLTTGFSTWNFGTKAPAGGGGGGGGGGVAYFCAGLPATIVGTDAGEAIQGTVGDDVIVGLGGDDVISGRGGNDAICGGDGDDTISGGDGNDYLYGEAGADLLRGGLARDRLHGGDAADELWGGKGNDRLFGDLGADSLYGNKGQHDHLDGGDGANQLDGGPGGADFGVNGPTMVNIEVV